MSRLERIEALFHQALELEVEQRAGFLKKECEGDSDLLREVQALIEADGSNDAFLEGPASVVESVEARTDPLPLEEGTVVGRYRLLSLIGAGGMGAVYKASDLRSGRIAAVKTLSPQLALSRSAVRRFYREAKAAASLKHPAIAQILDFGKQNGTYYIAMEYIEGETLSRRIERAPLSVKQVADILLQIADGLHEAHKKGIVHRDLKPSNLMLKEAGQVMILDFGLVKVREDIGQGEGGLLSTDTLTLPGTVLGTTDYMSPEQARGRHVDPRSDIFSLGVIAYQLLTDRLPFTGKTAGDILDNICHRRYYPIARFNPEASGTFEAIVAKCLCKDPRQRYQSVMELGEDLRKACGIDLPARRGFRRQKRQLLLLGGAIVVIALLILLLIAY